MLYYDSVTYHPEALDYFYRLMGADHLLFGSDLPLWATLQYGRGNGGATGLHPGGEGNDLPRQRGAVVGNR